MARRQIERPPEEIIMEAAGRLLGAVDVVLLVRGDFIAVRPTPEPVQPGQVPEDMSGYDAAIVRALTDNAVSSLRLARAAGLRFNSYFRQRVAALVEEGHIRHTRRGYARPGG